jgi:predicted DCC family thiol-disulfide oxidoreductase YuxK
VALPGDAVLSTTAVGTATPIIFFDGECAYCHWAMRFAMARDRQARLRAAPLGGSTAAQVLPPFGAALRGVDSLVFYTPAAAATEAGALVYSDAALAILRALGGVWAIAGTVGLLVPRWIRDGAYRLFAARRYQLFGRADACAVWPAEWRARVLP